jgi:hypothetical protein
LRLRWKGTSFMKYMAAVLLLVAATSAQNAPSTNKGDDTGIEGLPKGAIVRPLKAQHPRHLV